MTMTTMTTMTTSSSSSSTSSIRGKWSSISFWIRQLCFLVGGLVAVQALLASNNNHHHHHHHKKNTMKTRLVLAGSSSSSSTSTSSTSDNRQADRVSNEQSLRTSRRSSLPWNTKKSKSKCACPDDDVDDDKKNISLDLLEDRREALFAMMGGLWAAGAATTLPEALSLLSVAAVVGQPPQAAHATFGVDAKMTFPDVVQGLSDRNNKQCLVESLGNRECLVYQEDEEKLLYKGADTQVLLKRIQTAATALEQEIPPLVEKKSWTKITGVLTGPMGQLSSTMTLLCKLVAENPELAKQKAQVVKTDVFAMGSAATAKSAEDVLKYQQLAIQDLAIFLKSL